MEMLLEVIVWTGLQRVFTIKVDTHLKFCSNTRYVALLGAGEFLKVEGL